MDDAQREPVTSGTDDDERDRARTSTAEFRIPKNVSLTRPDIAIRRPAEPQDDTSEEPASPPAGPWYVEFPKPAVEDAPEQTSDTEDTEDAEDTEVTEETQDTDETEDAPAHDEPEQDESLPPPGPAEDATQPTPAAPQPAAPQPGAASETRPTFIEPRQGTSPQAGAGRPAAPPAAPPQQGRPGDGVAPPKVEPQGEPWRAAMPGVAPTQSPGAHGAPPSGGAGPTRVEPRPVLPPQGAPQEEYPSSRSSGQWSVPWDGTPPPAPSAPAAPSAPSAPSVEEGPKRGRRGLVVVIAALVLVVGVVGGQLVRPVPEPTVELAITSSHAFPGQAPALPWPTAGQSVVHVNGLGTMGASGGSTPTPTASVAKVMTAYVYLRDHPLKPGEAGPVLTVSPQAAAQIPMRKERGESILGVTANQRLTQRKALEALLIISANDVAHELARWDAGSDQAFAAKMNATAKSLGMTSTHYTDPSGYDSRTVSTAADQVKLLRAAMRVPAFAEIVRQRTYVPDDGGPARQGGNFLLGQYGVIGGKTGYTDAAGGNFVFAARKAVGGVPTLIVGAVMGQESPTAAGAINAARQLVVAAEGALTAKTLAPKGAKVAQVDDGLGGLTPLRAAAPVTVVGWPGLTVPVRVKGDPPHQGADGARVGTVTAGAATVPLELGRTLDEPSIVTRLTRLG